MWRRGASWSVAPAVMGGQRPDISGYFAPVGYHGERRGDEEDADAPGEGDPDFASDRLLLEQGSGRVDDRGDRLVFREGTHGTPPRGSGHGWRADERQEDDRI